MHDNLLVVCAASVFGGSFVAAALRPSTLAPQLVMPYMLAATVLGYLIGALCRQTLKT